MKLAHSTAKIRNGSLPYIAEHYSNNVSAHLHWYIMGVISKVICHTKINTRNINIMQYNLQLADPSGRAV